MTNRKLQVLLNCTFIIIGVLSMPTSLLPPLQNVIIIRYNMYSITDLKKEPRKLLPIKVEPLSSVVMRKGTCSPMLAAAMDT